MEAPEFPFLTSTPAATRALRPTLPWSGLTPKAPTDVEVYEDGNTEAR